MRIRSMMAALAVVAACAPMGAGAAQGAPRSGTSKVMLGLELNGTSIQSDDFDGSNSGGGATLRVGYGFTPRFAIFVDGSAATLSTDNGDWTLAHMDLGVRFHFASPTRSLVPFLEAAVTSRAVSPEDAEFTDAQGNTIQGDFELSGGGLTVGGGLLFFFNPRWAVSTGLKWTAGEFNTVRLNNVSVSGFEIDATSARFNIGVSWFPMAR